MNAKIYKDGNRIIVSFEALEDAEKTLEMIVRVLSQQNEPVIADSIDDLEPPEDNEEPIAMDESAIAFNEMQEPEIDDFDGVFAGMTPQEIMKVPKCEGFYFLCCAIRNNKVPSRYVDDVKETLSKFIEKMNVLKPPYGDVARMIKYCMMAQNILGKEEIPDLAYTCDDEQWLETTCRTACSLLQEFCEQYLRH